MDAEGPLYSCWAPPCKPQMGGAPLPLRCWRAAGLAGHERLCAVAAWARSTSWGAARSRRLAWAGAQWGERVLGEHSSVQLLGPGGSARIATERAPLTGHACVPVRAAVLVAWAAVAVLGSQHACVARRARSGPGVSGLAQ
eukprot:CAMPEP_0175762868 /NCGR_PEP_ID=MMETSP0097-20121207/67436_1 /TAXON_ID=311494 /ORGANISM="Alexandrium monilatum, Strain CCMP3105" /LENGTH=140 /DNA_ID=CAMNT_0017072565 /DNA_START=236 /DNA_END=658 /DNA_ORIENTATION=+